MKTKLPLLVSVIALIGYTKASNAQVLSQSSSNNNAENSILNVKHSDNSGANAIGITDNDLSSTGYHHGSSSGGDGGGFSQGKTIIYAGVGFVGSGIDKVYGTGSTSSSVGPAIEIGGERAINDHIGVGIHFGYQSASATVTSTENTFVFNPTTFTEDPVTYTNTDKYTVSVITLAARGAYHFSTGKLDPYIGAVLGYCFVSATDAYTTNDPNSESSTNSASVTGAEFGIYGGLRYFFNDHIGAWFEVQYTYAAFTVDGVTTGINTSNLVNLGIAFKF